MCLNLLKVIFSYIIGADRVFGWSLGNVWVYMILGLVEGFGRFEASRASRALGNLRAEANCVVKIP